MARLWRGYLRLLRDYTLPTQMATSGVIVPLGDSIAQHGVESKPFAEHDWNRTARFMVYGAFMWAPLQYNWHKQLNKIKFSDSIYKTGALRLLLDGTVFAPFGQCFFFTCMGFLEGRSWSNIRARLNNSFWYVYSRGLCVFGPVQILNLTVIPVYARPPVLNLVSLGWSTFLATVNRREPAPMETHVELMEAVAEQPV